MSSTYEDYLKKKGWVSWIDDDYKCFINSEPNEQCILGFENRSVND